MIINNVKQNNLPYAQKQAQVSFQGGSSFLKNISGKAGDLIPAKVGNFTELTSNASLTRKAFLALSLVFILGGRYFNARNSDERREVLTRDLSSIIAAIYAVPVMKNGYAKMNAKTTGVPVADQSIASSLQLKNWYTNVDKMKNGVVSFAENVDNLGGNVKKCFNEMGEEFSEQLGKIFKNGEVPENNKEVIKVLQKAKANKTLQSAINVIENAFKADNGLLKKATKLKSIPEFAAIAATAGLLGGLIPWINIVTTKHLHAKKEQQNAPTMEDACQQFFAQKSVQQTKKV